MLCCGRKPSQAACSLSSLRLLLHTGVPGLRSDRCHCLAPARRLAAVLAAACSLSIVVAESTISGKLPNTSLVSWVRDRVLGESLLPDVSWIGLCIYNGQGGGRGWVSLWASCRHLSMPRWLDLFAWVLL